MQHRTPVSLLVLAAGFSFLLACGASAEGSTESEPSGSESTGTTFGAPVSGSASADSASADVAATGTSSGTPSTTATDAGPSGPLHASPKPTKACSVTKDGNGFFWRTSAKSPYVAYVPASYTGTEPMRVVVGLHGCADNAMNFATWGVNPWDSRKTQQHIGISVSGETGSNSCWSKGNDDAKVLAAVEDLATCFWLDRSRVTLAGYSSGGELAYKVALEHADEFDGLLIEDSGLYANADPAALLAGAAWKLPIAHITHASDGTFPLAKVQADWAQIAAAGFPLATKVVAGTHSGTSDDWNTFLLPAMQSWEH